MNTANQSATRVGQDNASGFQAAAGFTSQAALGNPVGWTGATVHLESGESLTNVFVLGYLFGGIVITKSQPQDGQDIAMITNRIFVPYVNLRQVAETR